ncbi:hypothetical protein LPJ73_003912, partial [Coemansia sp. RSA 2703]
MQQQQQQQPQSSPTSTRRRTRHQSPQSRKSSLTRASVERTKGDNNNDDEIDSGELSPQSRRRHQSRKSSARLRERQRQRIHNAEEDVSKLEEYVRSLQQTINMHRHQAPANGGPEILDAMGIMHPNFAQQQQMQQCDSVSDEESRRNFDARVRQLILSLSEAMHQLGGCVERIDVLKQLLVGRVGLTEQALLEEMQQQSSSSDAMSISPPPHSMTESNMRKHTSGNSPPNSGNNSGSNSG